MTNPSALDAARETLSDPARMAQIVENAEDMAANPNVADDVMKKFTALLAVTYRAYLSEAAARGKMEKALEKISAMQWQDRSAVSEMTAWPAFQKANSRAIEIFKLADAALPIPSAEKAKS